MIMPTGVYVRTPEYRKKMSEAQKRAGNKPPLRKGISLSEEHKRKISIAHKGKKVSEETKLKLSKAHKGTKKPWAGKYKRTEEYKKKLKEVFPKGPDHPLWKGDNVGYHGIHAWVKKHLGRPSTCDNCGKNGLKGHQIHWANKSGEYKRDLNDWIRLCVSCHIKIDGHGLQKGHIPWNKGTDYIPPKGFKKGCTPWNKGLIGYTKNRLRDKKGEFI